MIDPTLRPSLLDDMARLDTAPVPVTATFVLPRSYRTLLAPETFVVRGSRGSGKTALAEWLCTAGPVQPPSCLGVPLEKLEPQYFFDAFSQRNIDHPEPVELDAFVAAASDDELRRFWMATFYFRLFASVIRRSPEVARQMLSVEDIEALGNTVEALRRDPMGLVRNEATWWRAVSSRLDVMDGDSRFPFVAVYDDLDAVGAFDPALRVRFIRALLAVWSAYATRFKRLRAKIFLPEGLVDLDRATPYEATRLLRTAAPLQWDHAALYGLVLQHLVQTSDTTRAWLADFGLTAHVVKDIDGWRLDDPPALKDDPRVVAWLTATLRKVVSLYGATSEVQDWIYYRLRDGRHEVTPRTILSFFRAAARIAQRDNETPHRNRLLAPEHAWDAMRHAGAMRFEELRQVYPWCDRLRVVAGRVLPIPREEFEALLDLDPTDEGQTLVPRPGKVVLRELLALGLLNELPGARIDVPDVFVRHLRGRRRARDETPPEVDPLLP